jgi:hypothetical protein
MCDGHIYELILLVKDAAWFSNYLIYQWRRVEGLRGVAPVVGNVAALHKAGTIGLNDTIWL